MMSESEMKKMMKDKTLAKAMAKMKMMRMGDMMKMMSMMGGMDESNMSDMEKPGMRM